MKAWMILERDKAAIFDYRLPIYWLRKQAIDDRELLCFDGRVVRVEIHMTKSQRRLKAK